MAANLLRDRGVKFPSNGDFYGQVLAELEAHPERVEIKALVDWIEEFDPQDELGKGAVAGSAGAGRRKGRGTLPPGGL